jgi:hypothetical protein
MYRIIALPVRVFNDTFALYKLEFDYFGLAYSQRNHVLMTASDLQKCSAGSVTVYPADKAIFDIQAITCKCKLYFQTIAKDGLCRSLILHYTTPTLLRQGDVWLFHLPSQQPLTARCPRGNTWKNNTQTHSGAGLIQNASMCQITAGEAQNLPEHHGTSRIQLDTPPVYTPDELQIVNAQELPDIKFALSSNINELDHIKDSVETSHKLLDVDTLLHVHNTSRSLKDVSCWNVINIATLCALIIVLILYLIVKPKCRNFIPCYSPTDTTLQPHTSIPVSEHAPVITNSDQTCDNVNYTYALPCLR